MQVYVGAAFWNVSETLKWTKSLQRKNKASERQNRNILHAKRHELHIVGVRQCCILECFSNTAVNEVAHRETTKQVSEQFVTSRMQRHELWTTF